MECNVTDYYTKKDGPCYTFKRTGECTHTREASEPFIGPRNEVHDSIHNKPNKPRVRVWHRWINHKRFNFEHIVMLDGEVRWVVTEYNGYGDDGTEEQRKSGMRFGCAWSRRKFVTFKKES